MILPVPAVELVEVEELPKSAERGARGEPVLTLSPEGMRLELRHPLARPDQVEGFVDLALELTRIVGP